MANDNANVITIQLSKGFFAKIDKEDQDLCQYIWHTAYLGKLPYAHRNVTVRMPGMMHTVIMTRILGRTLSKDEVVDHKNGDSLDNTRLNLRVATRQQNRFNSAKSSKSKSGYKGVSFYKRDGNWQATITLNRKQKHLGYFNTPEEAHEAYKKAAIELHGEFARWE